jgi:hypothetical protein
MPELIFYNEDYFFERFGYDASDNYLFVGKTYVIEQSYYILPHPDWIVNNPRLKRYNKWRVKFSPFVIDENDIEKLFCTKKEYRKHKLRKLENYENNTL